MARHALRLIVYVAFLTSCVAFAQHESAVTKKYPLLEDPARLQPAIEHIKTGKFDLMDVEIITAQHATEAIPALKLQFAGNNDVEKKRRIASALVKLGERDGPYWNFLVIRANQSLQDEPPNPFEFDSNGKAIAKPTEGLKKWAESHHMPLGDALMESMKLAGEPIMDLARADDPRAIPILRKALGSKYFFTRVDAARGLAALHDAESVPAIVQACEKSPKEVAGAIAQSLVYFDDPAAQHALESYVPKGTVEALRTKRAQGRGPYQ